jgi:hypothetical protein
VKKIGLAETIRSAAKHLPISAASNHASLTQETAAINKWHAKRVANISR